LLGKFLLSKFGLIKASWSDQKIGALVRFLWVSFVEVGCLRMAQLFSMLKQFAISPTAEIHESVVFGPNCVDISIGHATRIRAGTYIDVPKLSIGDYVTISPGVVIHGQEIAIGHNCWIGQYSILDGHGGLLFVGNNVGIGAHSQLWSHMKFGDRLDGCRWYRMSDLIIEDDVWLVGHCLVTPIVARAKSMLMLGGLATHDMEANQIYAGSPAINVTDKFGPQFEAIPLEKKRIIFHSYLEEFHKLGNAIDSFLILEGVNSPLMTNKTYFDLESRQYFPTFSDIETKFVRFMLYDRAKFLPAYRPNAGL
jgi:acetyltransferase-like isoleucine patch superfamily enzyme